MTQYIEDLEQLISLAEDAIYEADYKQAERLLYNALYDEPGYARLHYTLAWMYHDYHENEAKAIRHYELTIYFDKSFTRAYYGLANLLMDREEYDKLEVLLTKAVTAPKIDQAYVYGYIGKLMEKQRKYNPALEHYRKALMACLDNDDSAEMKKNIKRIKFKRFKTRWSWQRQN